MDKNKQRIAIAEECGWTLNGSSENNTHPYVSPSNGIKKHLPDYCNDLNAMHEAEKVLLINPPIQHEYADCLRVTLGGSGRTQFDIYHSTAAQRAEAFLKIIGKWEESK
jgi:hypothetical protein